MESDLKPLSTINILFKYHHRYCSRFTLCVVMESDLKPLSTINILFKYPNDNNLLVPENTDEGINAAFDNILKWAADNHVIVNRDKTKENSYDVVVFTSFCNWN